MAVAKNTKTVEAYLECTTEGCNHITQIRRVRGRKQPVGHIKTTYCFKCKKETDHVEQNKDDMMLPQWIKDRDKKLQEDREARINAARR